MSREGHPVVQEPITLDERRALAGSCSTGLDLKDLPTLVDRMDDAVGKAYAAHPDRLYLVGRDGKIAYAGGPGPMGFKPDELEEAIKKVLDGKKGPQERDPGR